MDARVKGWLAAATMTLGLVAPTIASAQDDGTAYVGLWQGIDRKDGGVTMRSIYRDARGTFHVLAASEYFSTCAAADGRGTLEAEAELVEGVLRAHDTVITCANGEVFERLPDEYHHDPASDLLTHKRVGDARPDFVLHRMSDRP